MAAPPPELVDTFLEVARIEGVSGNERVVADHIRRVLEDLGMDVREDDAARESGGNCGNLVARAGTGGAFALMSHMDTARPSGQSRAIVHADRITSDGTTVLGVDDRAGIAMLLYAARQVLAHGRGRRDFTLAFTVAEESSLAGSRTIRFEPPTKMAILFDSSLRPGNFIARSFGCQRLWIKVHGRASHSGIAPEKGIDAIAVAARAIARLPLGRIDASTTSNIGMIQGGLAVNVVPEQVALDAEVRSLAKERVDEIVGVFGSTFEDEAARAGARVTFRAEWDFESYAVDESSELYRRVATALRAVGLEPTPQVSAGGSDANSLNARGIPAINLGIGAQNPHGNDEFILLDDLDKGAAIALALLSQARGR
ncbi:MAG: M20/M25/M40 family metallo-hydrolase [Acidobacteria bacterium]|nr:M20/M25/M40 family metallo-hydrolase [Acidobacteriota bacterium]